MPDFRCFENNGNNRKGAVFLYEDFLRELMFSCGYSDNTISAYKRDLTHYKEFCDTGRPIQAFYHFLTKKNLSHRSQARILSCVRTYLKFLQRRGHPAVEIKYLKPPRLKNKLPKPVKLREFKALWKVCETDNLCLSLRNKLVLAFLYGLGCRVSELVSLNLQDFNETEAWISVVGKGNKQRLLPLTEKLYQLILLYLKKSRPELGRKAHPALFFNNRGNRPTRVDIWRWLKSWSLKAGFDEVKNPHAFRHGFATGLLERGADIISIQKLLGHLSVQTTQIYTSVRSETLKQAVDDFHPLSRKKGA